MTEIPNRNPATGSATSSRVATTAARAAPWAASARYWIVLGLLLAAMAAVKLLPIVLGIHARKEAVPLVKELAFFDVKKLGPRYERHPETDALYLSEEALDTLGTHDVFQAYLTDTEGARKSPLRLIHLFITYYTGKPNLVPHVPDECYIAGGYEKVDARVVDLTVPGIGAENDHVPVRVITFRAAERRGMAHGDSGLITVLYFFHANDRYAATRNDVRMVLADPFARYAYYAKVEVSFPQASRLDLEQAQEQSLEALVPLLQRVMPQLIREHFDVERFGHGPVPERATEAERG